MFIEPAIKLFQLYNLILIDLPIQRAFTRKVAGLNDFYVTENPAGNRRKFSETR